MELGGATITSKPPQISEMFQKFAIAFKAKTFEFFTEEEESAANSASVSAAVSDNEDGFTLLDSTEYSITDQKVIIVKPDFNSNSKSQSQSQTARPASNSIIQIQPFNSHFGNYLISSVFTVISSFEASYLQLQTAHVPFDEDGIMINDKALIFQLQKLYVFRDLYIDSRKNPNFNLHFTTGSCLQAQVNENQNKLRALETMFNRLQSDIDGKDDKVLMLRRELGEIEECNSNLSIKLSKILKPPNGFLPAIRVFDSMLRDAFRSSHRFTKVLIQLMKKAGYDLDLAASYVHPNVVYSKKGHNRYAFLSYVSLGMFQGFDSESFGVAGNESCNDNSMELFEHVSVNPLEETLNKNPNFPFSKFCERKYKELVHPTMESSIFKNLDRKKEVLDSWKSLGVFYNAFVNMSSSMWLLHNLARSFTPPVEIFQLEKGIDFSMVYMEDVTKKDANHDMGLSKVGFTVVPGFKIGRTIVQSQVYLTGLKHTN